MKNEKINSELLKALKVMVAMVEKITPVPGYPYGVGVIENAYQIGVCAINKANRKP